MEEEKEERWGQRGREEPHFAVLVYSSQDYCVQYVGSGIHDNGESQEAWHW